MKKTIKPAMAAAAAAALQGCASITSAPIIDGMVALTPQGTPKSVSTVSGLRYALPKGRLKMQVTAGFFYYPTMKKMKGALELAQLAPAIVGVVDAPDSDAQFFLKLNPSILSDDDFCIGVGENGLLSSVGVVTADRSADIVKKLAETAAVFFGGPPVPAGGILSSGAGPRRTNGIPVWDKAPFVEVVFDPDSKIEVEAAQKTIAAALIARGEAARQNPSLTLASTREEIKAKNLVYEANPELLANMNSDKPYLVATTDLLRGKELNPYSDDRFPGVEFDKPNPSAGVFYRVRSDRSFEVKPAGGLQGRLQQSIAALPDKSSTGFIKVSRGALIRKETGLALKDGMLVSVHVNKPSEALAVVSLPLDVAGAVIETPARFFSSIAAATRSDTALLSAKAELLQAEVEFLKAAKGEEAKVPQGAAFPAASPGIASPLKPPAAFSSGLTCSQG
jgi:hypothetical protein